MGWLSAGVREDIIARAFGETQARCPEERRLYYLIRKSLGMTDGSHFEQAYFEDWSPEKDLCQSRSLHGLINAHFKPDFLTFLDRQIGETGIAAVVSNFERLAVEFRK